MAEGSPASTQLINEGAKLRPTIRELWRAIAAAKSAVQQKARLSAEKYVKLHRRRKRPARKYLAESDNNLRRGDSSF